MSLGSNRGERSPHIYAGKSGPSSGGKGIKAFQSAVLPSGGSARFTLIARSWLSGFANAKRKRRSKLAEKIPSAKFRKRNHSPFPSHLKWRKTRVTSKESAGPSSAG